MLPHITNEQSPSAGSDQGPGPGPDQGANQGTAAVAPPLPSPPPASTATPNKSPAPPSLDKLPPFKVLLHNDDVNAFEHVCIALMELFAFDIERAFDVTDEANNTGVALVMVTHKELAELKAQQLQSKGLTATIEPA